LSDPIVREELELLSDVSTLLSEVPYIVPPSEKSVVADLLRLREDMPNAKAEDKGSLMEQYNAQLSLLEQLREARKRPQVDPDSPYFAHMRLREGDKVRDLCLGKATRIQRGVRIIDWRNAPISQLFYRYQQGEEYEEEMAGRTMVGEVAARRTVTIKRGELLRIDAPEGTYHAGKESKWTKADREAPRLAGGEGQAARAHAAGSGDHRRMGTDMQGSRRRADKRLPDIAGLIDPEQFELITKPHSGFVVIRGTAGSGKTTVALHRIAWLAYDDPQIDTERTLFLVFSQALRDYVGHVLPSLGTPNVQIRTYHDWSAGLRRRHFGKLPRKLRDDTPAIVLRLKHHPALIIALEQQVARVAGRPNAEQAMDDWISVLTDLSLLTRVFNEHAPNAFTATQLERATTWNRDRANELMSWLDGDKDEDARLDPEDDPILLRAWQLRVGPLRGQKRRPLRYRHVAVDEVQDFTPLEIRVLLGCLDKRQSITLAGDTQQHVMQDAGFTSWADFFRHLGVPGTEVSTLRISYRCSYEVMTFARALLGELAEDSAPVTTRRGPEVELFRFTDHGAAVAFLADALNELVRDEPMASIAILTAGRDVSAMYYDGLDRGEVPRLRRVTQQDFTFKPGVEITEIDQVKGLEFDYVILAEASAARFPDTPSARRLLHVGATRAVHQLWLTSVAAPSSILSEALAT
jgi:DNA helicase-2/ATP-dependent DNA helicase PcrA